jgi:hypothetical protein
MRTSEALHPAFARLGVVLALPDFFGVRLMMTGIDWIDPWRIGRLVGVMVFSLIDWPDLSKQKRSKCKKLIHNHSQSGGCALVADRAGHTQATKIHVALKFRI